MVGVLSLASPVQADWQLLPKNSHQLYQTYGHYLDFQSAFTWYGNARSHGTLGGSIPLVGDPDTPAHPQVVIVATATAAMWVTDSDRIYSDEIDARAGFLYEFALAPAYRVSLGLIHHSGHTADGVRDASLMIENLGDNFFTARGVYDWGPYARVGATFMVYLTSGPSMKTFAFDQFIEWFPWGGQDDTRTPSPYVALGLHQHGTTAFGYSNTFHAQIGAYIGNHFSNDFKQTLRLVAGFYTGADPRLKYYQFRNETPTFGYLGLMADI